MGVREVRKIAPLGLVPTPRSPASAHPVDTLLLPKGCSVDTSPAPTPNDRVPRFHGNSALVWPRFLGNDLWSADRSTGVE
jgi:hypothetical protein